MGTRLLQAPLRLNKVPFLLSLFSPNRYPLPLSSSAAKLNLNRYNKRYLIEPWEGQLRKHTIVLDVPKDVLDSFPDHVYKDYESILEVGIRKHFKTAGKATRIEGKMADTINLVCDLHQKHGRGVSIHEILKQSKHPENITRRHLCRSFDEYLIDREYLKKEKLGRGRPLFMYMPVEQNKVLRIEENPDKFFYSNDTKYRMDLRMIGRYLDGEPFLDAIPKEFKQYDAVKFGFLLSKNFRNEKNTIKEVYAITSVRKNHRDNITSKQQEADGARAAYAV